MIRSISPPWLFLNVRLSAGVFLAFALAAGQQVELRDGTFRLPQWTGGLQPPRDGWQAVFPVYAGSSTTPMLGTYSVEGGALVFHPRFPLDPNTSYHGTFPNGGFAFDAKAASRVPVRVEHIYPSADVLPANTLRVYVWFSAPVNRGDALEHIRLLDAAGNPITGAFLDQELWDPDHRRLTLLFDPGRVKRGLVPSKQAGSPIVEGRRYTLAVDRDLAAQGFEKHFTAGPPLRTAADPAQWQIHAPSAGTTEPLIVEFPRPMDYALLQRTLSIPGISGKISVGKAETEWRFTPDSAWKPGAHRLSIGSDLEDICGNHPDRPFEVDLHAASPSPPRAGPGAIRFYVRR
jgi:hypothetical protein